MTSPDAFNLIMRPSISGLTNTNYPGNSDILLYRLSKDGEIVWRKVLGGNKGDIAHCLLKRPDNTLMMIGYSAEKRDSLSDPLILHLNTSGDVIEKFQLEPEPGIDIKLIDGFIDAKGDCVGTGFMRSSLKSPFDVVFFKLDFAKKNLSIKKLPLSTQTEEAYGTALLSNGNALIVGHTMSKHEGDMLFIKWSY